MLADPSTGVPVVDAAVGWSLGVAAVCALLAMVWRGMRALVKIAKSIDHMADDWNGVPARPGVPGRPGLVARVAALERLVGWVLLRFPDAPSVSESGHGESALLGGRAG